MGPGIDAECARGWASANKARSDADLKLQKQARIKLEQEQVQDAKAWIVFGESLEAQCAKLNIAIAEYGLRLKVVEHEKRKLSVTVIHANARSEASAAVTPSEAGMAQVQYLKPKIGNSFSIDLHSNSSAHIEEILLKLLEFHVEPK